MTADNLRCAWRTLKCLGLNQHTNKSLRWCVEWLQPIASRIKHWLPMTSLADRALYLLYHPQYGYDSRDSYRATHINPTSEEMQEVYQIYKNDLRRSKVVLRVREVYLDCLLCVKALPQRRVAIHIHVFYREEAKLIIDRMSVMPCPFDLFISAPKELDLSFVPKTCKIIRCENRGRDIMPFFCMLAQELSTYDYVCHLHTKRSPHLYEHGSWLDFILNSLLPDAEGVKKIFGLLENGAGIVSACEYMPRIEDPSGWGANKKIASELAMRFGLKIDIQNLNVVQFPAGSMIWCRGDFMKCLSSLNLCKEDFPKEPIPDDGTIAHALERMFYLFSSCAGMDNVQLMQKMGE